MAESWSLRLARWVNRVQARRSAGLSGATAFVSQPEPRTIGNFSKGRQLVAGNLQFAGHIVEAPGEMLWALDPPDEAFTEEIQGFVWLDDLAAVGDANAQTLASEWLFDWIARYGNGQGPGWLPELAGRRLIRWIHHAVFVLRGADPQESRAFFRALTGQTRYLARRWSSAPPGLSRFEALTGLIYAGLSLEGMERYVKPALRALDKECAKHVDGVGGVATRNPEELLDIFTMLTWAGAAMTEAGHIPSRAHVNAIERIAPTVRTLRHSDGSLARFHGGGRGIEGRLDQALAASGVKSRTPTGLAMGFARLSGGRTSVIVDADRPPKGRASLNAHASTLAFELTSGRRPLIVNCGSGAIFGEEWRQAGRATPSHSTLALEGYSSARLGPVARLGKARREELIEVPTDVPSQILPLPDGTRFEGAHNGYVRGHGLTHARILELTVDGKGLVGEDLLVALGDKAKATFDKVLDKSQLQGIPFQIRFHLHPEVDASVDMGGAAISLVLKSGEVWVFRPDGDATMALEPSVYLEKGRLRPRATSQIVLSGRAMQYATRIRWSLAKAHDSGVAIRDLNREDLMLH